MLFELVNNTLREDDSLKTVGDWVNLIQLAAVLGLCLLLFLMGLYYPSDHSRRYKFIIVICYLTFMLISIIPLLIDIMGHYIIGSWGDTDRDFALGLFLGLHYFYVHPIIFFVGLFAWLPQSRELDSRTRLHALSMTGLAVQAITFTIVGISWIFRINLFGDALTRLPFWLTVTDWLKLVWWAAEDNLVFAAVQAGLFFKARRKARLQTGGETEPLLRDREGDS